MSYEIKIETRHTARVACRLIPTTNAIGYIATKNALSESAETTAAEYGMDVEFRPNQGGYTITFSKDAELEPVRAAATAFVDWLYKEQRYIPQ